MITVFAVALLSSINVGFEWEILLQDNLTAEVRTFRTFGELAVTAGSFRCTVTPGEPSTIAGGVTMQFSSIICTYDSGNELILVAGPSATCARGGEGIIRDFNASRDGAATLTVGRVTRPGEKERYTLRVRCLNT
jgi:hypothetical protein